MIGWSDGPSAPERGPSGERADDLGGDPRSTGRRDRIDAAQRSMTGEDLGSHVESGGDGMTTMAVGSGALRYRKESIWANVLT